jgi:hypothetical protein
MRRIGVEGDPLHVAAEATVRRLTHLDRAAEEQVVRGRAWQILNSEDEMSHRMISRAMWAVLAEMNLSEEEIARAGISHYNIGLVLKTMPRAATV